MSYVVDSIFGCELVTSRLDADGYAYAGKSRAHILAWEAAHGPVPDGMEIDHLCRRRNCRAVHHLEAVTRLENDRRRSWSYRVRRTKCSAGHDLRTQRAVTEQGGITCRACNQAALARRGASA
jgi:hypothetical protein